jgi:hypothetical protein
LPGKRKKIAGALSVNGKIKMNDYTVTGVGREEAPKSLVQYLVPLEFQESTCLPSFMA